MKVTPTEAIAIGEQFFRSGMFADIKSAGQAVVKIMAGAEIGIPPFAAMSGIHIIQGKPTIAPQLMLALINRSSELQDIKIDSQDTECVVTMIRLGMSGVMMIRSGMCAEVTIRRAMSAAVMTRTSCSANGEATT